MRLLFILVLLLFACSPKQENTQIKENIYLNKYATGFNLWEKEEAIFINIGNNKFKVKNDSVFDLTNKKTCVVPKNIAVGSSTHTGYFLELDNLNLIKGIGCDLKYFQNQTVVSSLKQNKAFQFANMNEIDSEKLIRSKIDLLIYYPFAHKENSLIETSNIIEIPMSEYLEAHPLGQLEWLYVIGALTGKLEEAKTIITKKTTEYNEICMINSSQDLKETFILDLPFNGTWNMSQPKSARIKLLGNTGLTYQYKEVKSENNLALNIEDVLLNSKNVDYWIIQGDFKEDILEHISKNHPMLTNMEQYKNKQIIYCNISKKPLFETGYNINPQIIIKDLLIATEKIKDSSYIPVYFEKYSTK
jgi:iron complex transport system substrate-binding protein